MPKVIFRTVPMVWVTIKGETKDPFSDPEDGGLIEKFERFLRENKISNTSGDFMISTIRGTYKGSFAADDMPAIEDWLTKQGAERA